MKTKLLYWIPTVLAALFLGAGALADALRVEGALTLIRHLGYPDYFATMIGIAKLLGVVALLLPVPRTLREWAYAGFTFDLIGAAISQATVGDPIGEVLIPVITLAVVHLSYWAWRQRSTGAENRPVAPVLQHVGS